MIQHTGFARCWRGPVGGKWDGVSKSSGDRRGDCLRCAGIRMPVVRNAPGWIKRNEHIIEAAVIQNPAAKLAFARQLRAELRYDNQRYCPALLHKFACGAQNLPRQSDAVFDRLTAAIVHDASEERGQSPMILRRQPHETEPKVRPVDVEVAVEDRWCKQRDHRDWPAKTRQ